MTQTTPTPGQDVQTVLLPNSKLVPLTHGKFAIVDNEDFEKVSKHRWHFNKYAISRIDGKAVFMHKYILPKSQYAADHINQNKLDNRKENLRFCTSSQNNQNCGKRNRKATSKYKGVCYDKWRNSWKARIGINRKDICLGYHHTEIEAAIAYNNAAKQYFGEFACLNQI